MSTKAEKEHIDAVAALGCIACRNLHFGFSDALIHHVRTIQGRRITRNDMLVLPLCWRHHSADSPYGFHAGSRTWQRAHGTEETLLAQVAKLLEAQR